MGIAGVESATELRRVGVLCRKAIFPKVVPDSMFGHGLQGHRGSGG